MLLVAAVLGLIFLAWVAFRDTSAIDDLPTWTASPRSPPPSRYLSQTPYLKYTHDSTHYRFAIISDMDTASHIDKSLVFKAEVKEGRLMRKNGQYSIEWDATVRYF